MTEADITNVAIAALVKIRPAHHTIDASTPFAELKLDSLDMLEWFMEIEQKLGIELDLPELADCKTISDVANWIVTHKGLG